MEQLFAGISKTKFRDAAQHGLEQAVQAHRSCDSPFLCDTVSMCDDPR